MFTQNYEHAFALPAASSNSDAEQPVDMTLRSATSLRRSSIHGPRMSDGFANERWYVVYTQPGAESRATIHLKRQGYQVFCPRYLKTVRHARRTKSIPAPLFPNYLFLRLDVSRDPWRAINGTRGVVRLIMQGEAPQPVPKGIVDDLQARIGPDGTIDWKGTFKIGQAVRIANGPFATFVGTLEHLDAAGRVRVLLDLLGRSVSVALRSKALLPAAATTRA